jgi:hypothetical protein
MVEQLLPQIATEAHSGRLAALHATPGRGQGLAMPVFTLPPAPPMLKVPPRRQARVQLRRAATCWHSCCQRINLSRSPTPPTEGELRPGRGRPEGKGVGAIGFFHPGCHRHSRGPVDCIACHYAQLGSTKRGAEFPSFEVPRVGPFLPRVCLFRPRVLFSAIQTISLSFSFFIEGERGREGAQAAKSRSTGPKHVTNMYPRVGDPIHGFSVDCFLSKSEQRRGFAGDRIAIHASTGRSACVPPAVAWAGGVHG